MKAVLIFKRGSIEPNGDRIEAVIWRIPASGRIREKIRYRIAFIPVGFGVPVVLYDNHEPKGHHKHLAGVEGPYAFSDIAALIRDFEADVEDWKESRV